MTHSSYRHYYESINGGEPACIDEQIPFDIPDSWEWVRAGSIFEIWSARRVHQSDWKKEGIPFYRAREIGRLSDYGIVNNELFISNQLFNELSTSGLPKKGDLMITAVGTLGKVYIVRENDRFYFKDASVISFRNYGSINPEYLRYLIASAGFKEQITNESAGTTVGTITIVKAKEYLMPIPPLSEQCRIATKIKVLEKLVAEYHKHEQSITSLNTCFPEALKKSILQHAIQGKLVPQDPTDEPASVLLERIAKERAKMGKKAAKSMSRIERRDRGTYEIFPDGSEVDISEEVPFDLPTSWEWARLGCLCSKIGAGSTPKGGRAIYKSEGILFLRSQNVYNDGLRFANAVFIDESIDASMSGSRVEPFDLLLNITGASIGRCAIVPDGHPRANINQHVLILRCIERAMLEYVHTCIISPLVFKSIMDMQVGATKEGLSAQKAGQLLIPIPPIKEQHRIITSLRSFPI